MGACPVSVLSADLKGAKPYLDVTPIARASGTMTLPGSKSISIRALLLSALATGSTELTGVLDSDDTRVMRAALRSCGVAIRELAPGHIVVDGGLHLAGRELDIFVGNSGLSARTLVAILALGQCRARLYGVPRMHERPIADLVDALTGIGARIAYLGNSGFPPLQIEPSDPITLGQMRVRASESSQFLTGVLQAAPLLTLERDVQVVVDGPLISSPYVDMTLNLMRRFGVKVSGKSRDRDPCFIIPERSMYRSPGQLSVEGDASSASYFLALGALAGGPVRVTGVGRDSIQGDVQFADALQAMGAHVVLGEDYIEASSIGVARGFKLNPLDLDCNHIPDAAMTLAVLALFASGPSVLRNIGSWRVKETDRLHAMACELAKLGATVNEGTDSLTIVPPRRLCSASVDTYDDHRMAMSLALAACGDITVRVNDPGCVAKTNPRYFEQIRMLTGLPID
jgi:3-phosphoshikimate 1-carboxyvinyltransferase